MGQKISSRRQPNASWLCLWPQLEITLFERFFKEREAGRPVRRGWFRRQAKQLSQNYIPMHLGSLCFHMLGLSTSYENGVLALDLYLRKHPKFLKNIISLFKSGFDLTTETLSLETLLNEIRLLLI